ncbi:cytochrome c oxidase subunit VA [Microdochium trichocladiopsis]|uniref:Cytochrome c oxidase subunit 6, mitochondrial n=1 Tax=Microdochium trichocladiopsis TaxID=1682393 RepID=A0A9P8Y9W6_9PEZI|nr:cytochrome c oxidase subunit VA [Microdochium trichocladiopsis]KAH7033455.1 cytochrome c oxidase subunit VA [Microdochium trichocladiopsis]
MSSSSIMRVAARAAPSKTFFRAYRPVAPGAIAPGFFLSSTRNFSSTVTRRSGHEETFEEFTARYEKEFEAVQDVFELQRNLNNAFAYDLVPSPSVCEAAIKAARRVNDYPTAVRVFEGIKAKTENKGQYEQYLEELKPLREELGILLKEDMYPEESK